MHFRLAVFAGKDNSNACTIQLLKKLPWYTCCVLNKNPCNVHAATCIGFSTWSNLIQDHASSLIIFFRVWAVF